MEKLTTRRTQRLRTLFLKYLAAFCVITLVLLSALLAFFVISLALGWINPASAVETQLLEQKSEIESAPEVTAAMIPNSARYAVYSLDGAYLYGDMDESEAQKAWDVAEEGSSANSGYSYMAIDRTDQVCIVRYLVKPTYGSDWANDVLPSPDILLVGGFLIIFLGSAALMAVRFGRTLSKRMAGLTEATENIQAQNLDFEIRPSGIYEIDQTLASMDSLRHTLKESLETQWEMEQARKQQISSLAHDIKAPLTVISGNADLLNETETSEPQREYLDYILSGAAQLEGYVRQMIDVAQSQQPRSLDLEPMSLEAILGSWKEKMAAFAAPQAISSVVETDAHTEQRLQSCLLIDKDLLDRAFLNILANGVEHTLPHGQIKLSVRAHAGTVEFSLIDGGTGFSAEDLQNAVREFYRGDKARTPGTHYGMGLFIADTIVRQHGGSLSVANAPEGGGAVTMALPFDGAAGSSDQPLYL